jgi:toxin HigB-1
MIRRFRHRGLRRLYADDDRRGLNADHVDKIARILAFLNRVTRPEDMNLPGFRLHPLKGNPCRLLERHHLCQLADCFSLRERRRD